MSQPAYTLSNDNVDAAAIARALIGPAALIAASLALIGGYRSRARIGAWLAQIADQAAEFVNVDLADLGDAG